LSIPCLGSPRPAGPHHPGAADQFIQRELTARTGMLDCGTHPKTWELLRMTRMPAVRIELGYLTNPEDRRTLLDPAFRDVVAEGVLVAVERLYLLSGELARAE
jgi:N-acetylmuramoyl-L-alanine amidase